MTIHKLSPKQQQWISQNIADYKKAIRYNVEKIVLLASPEKSTYTFLMINSSHDIIQCVFNSNGKFWSRLDSSESKELRSEARNLNQGLSDDIFEPFKEALRAMDISGTRNPAYREYLEDLYIK